MKLILQRNEECDYSDLEALELEEEEEEEEELPVAKRVVDWDSSSVSCDDGGDWDSSSVQAHLDPLASC